MNATLEQPPLTDPLRIGDVEISNRVLLAPLAGIGNWFVRLQAKRHGPAWRSPRWSPASASTTATSAPCAS